jgi:hypothetical protein
MDHGKEDSGSSARVESVNPSQLDLQPVADSRRKLNTITENDRLDEEIFGQLSVYKEFGRVPNSVTLLTLLTSGDKKLVKFSGKEASQFLDNHQLIEKELQKGWEEESFADVRNLGVSQIHPMF